MKNLIFSKNTLNSYDITQRYIHTTHSHIYSYKLIVYKQSNETLFTIGCRSRFAFIVIAAEGDLSIAL